MTINLSISGQGRPLVLFHGWGFDSQIWQPLLVELNPYFQVYCVDLPGFGQSSLMDWQDFKTKLFAQLPQEFALAGWSLGGLFASRLATEEPQRISHLINIASSPRFVEAENWAGIKPVVLAGFFELLAQDPAETMAHFQRLQKYKPSYIPQHLPSTKALAAGLEALKSWDVREALDGFKKPTCFMFGRLDAITPFAVIDHMSQRYPHFQYQSFRKSAHMPFLSESSLFLDKLKDFLL